MRYGRAVIWVAISTLLLAAAPLQTTALQGYSPKDLSLVVFRDGSVNVAYAVQVTQTPSSIQLVGFDQSTSSTLKVEDSSKTAISYSRNGTTITVSTSPGTIVVANYTTFALTSKLNNSWTLLVNSPVSWSVTFPLNTTVLAFNTTPLEFFKGSPPYIVLPPGNVAVTYRLSPNETHPRAWFPISPFLAILAAGALLVGGSSLMVYRRYQWSLKGRRLVAKHEGLNEVEKQILLFLAKSRGKALETEVARALELSRTSAWRHVRNLEEQGLVVTEKFGTQNLVKIKA